MEKTNTRLRRSVVAEFFVPSPGLSEMVRHDSLSIELLRARITAFDAWVRVRITGSPAEIDAFLWSLPDKSPTAQAVA